MFLQHEILRLYLNVERSLYLALALPYLVCTRRACIESAHFSEVPSFFAIMTLKI